MAITLSFHGAAGTVTGSHYVLSSHGAKIAIDCGLFQGPKALKELNYRNFPCDPQSIKALVLTHAHIDHAGALPKLVKQGFSGPIHATPETIDLLTWMLPDSAAIQESEVEQLNRRRQQSGNEDVYPIYDQRDVEQCLSQIRSIAYGEWRKIAKGIQARWWNAGHILGSASIEIAIEQNNPQEKPLTLLFSGDVGPKNGALQFPAEAPSHIDYLIVESTYGDREREELDDEKRRKILEQEVHDALKRGGLLIVPAFAIERTQELIGDLTRLIAMNRLPQIPIYVDSPLASHATEVFERYLRRLDDVDHAQNPFRTPNIRYVQTIEQSQTLNRLRGGAIIIAGSGMCDAGRVRHHLRHHLWQPKTSVFLIGYQAPGTLGRLLEEGASEVRIMGQPISVKAKIRRLEIYSGHADRNHLLQWVKERSPIRKGIFLVHGEEPARLSMKEGLAALGMEEAKTLTPELDQTYRLDLEKAALYGKGKPRLSPIAAKEAKEGWDWHNELSALTLELRRHLDTLSDDKKRLKLLQDVRRKLKR